MNHNLKKGEDLVFLLKGKKYKGTVLVVDSNGTFVDRNNVYYDILAEDEVENKILLKHIKEEDIEILS